MTTHEVSAVTGPGARLLSVMSYMVKQMVWGYGGFHIWGIPNSWLVFVRENPRIKWMITIGVPPWLWKPIVIKKHMEVSWKVGVYPRSSSKTSSDDSGKNHWFLGHPGMLRDLNRHDWDQRGFIQVKHRNKELNKDTYWELWEVKLARKSSFGSVLGWLDRIWDI